LHKIIRREVLSPQTFLWEIEAPDMSQVAQPGHFLIIRLNRNGERLPFTVADFDRQKGTITIVVQVVGKSTKEMLKNYEEGDTFSDMVGPLGKRAEIEKEDKVVLVGGGLGTAPVFPQLREYKEKGSYTISIVGFRNKDLVFWEDNFKKYSDEFYVATDDGSYGHKGFVTDLLDKVLKEDNDVTKVVAIGPLIMMRECIKVAKKYKVPTTNVSINSIMVDGTGMCGGCRVNINGTNKFACVDGPDFDGYSVDFDELMLRQNRFKREEQRSLKIFEEECELQDQANRRKKKIKDVLPTRIKMPEQTPGNRIKNFDEVALGYSEHQALEEAARCIDCAKPSCVKGCPVEIDIPGFIREITKKNYDQAFAILKENNPIPAVCGRVCPQEVQCEGVCILGKKVEPVAIGRLERFVADTIMQRGEDPETPEIKSAGKKAAMIGSGPGSISCAGELARHGVDVTIFEAFHVPGGVLKYGIPDFRLPNPIIDKELKALKEMGVDIEVNKLVGKIFTIDDLMKKKGFDAVFIASGAGLPNLLRVPGVNYNGVMSANEFLTRVNLMSGYKKETETPVGMGRKVCVIGSGNTAMDATRCALRMGADEVTCVYRRSRNESPARAEELHHAEEEGVKFQWLTNPVKINADDEGWVSSMECVRMELGEPDESGRRRPNPIEGSNFTIDCDTVIIAVGTNANPTIPSTTPGLETNEWNYIKIDEKTGMTSLPGVFAGGDVVTGSATVIQAMGAGKRAARGIMRYLGLELVHSL
jgi:glutamate synthase (NADPH) small chain